MKTAAYRFLLGAVAGVWVAAGVGMGTGCGHCQARQDGEESWLFFPGKGKVAYYALVHDREEGRTFYIVYPNMNRAFTLEEAVAKSPHFGSLEELERFRDQMAPDFALCEGPVRFPESWPYADITPLPKELKEKVSESMTLDEIRNVLGLEHEAFGSGLSYLAWYFDDDTCLTIVLPMFPFHAKEAFFWLGCEPGMWTFERMEERKKPAATDGEGNERARGGAAGAEGDETTK